MHKGKDFNTLILINFIDFNALKNCNMFNSFLFSFIIKNSLEQKPFIAFLVHL